MEISISGNIDKCKYQQMEIWTNRNMEKWKCGLMEILSKQFIRKKSYGSCRMCNTCVIVFVLRIETRNL